jgi:hypothetical protein
LKGPDPAWRRRFGLTSALGLLAAAGLAASTGLRGDEGLAFRLVKSFAVPGKAEIVAASPDGRILAYTDSKGARKRIGIVGISDPSAPSLLASIPVSGEPTSVSILGTWAVATVWTGPPEPGSRPSKPEPGRLLLIDLEEPATPALAGSVEIGHHPDSVKLARIAGTLLAVVAIENEPLVVEEGRVTRETRPGHPMDTSAPGLVQVVLLDTARPEASAVRDVPFPEPLLAKAGLLFPGDPQPEFVAIHGETAAVSLQENNGIALLDLATPASPRILSVFSVGTAGDRPADLTEDGKTSLTETYPADVAAGKHPGPTDASGKPVPPGARMPDAVAFSPDGTAIYAADEGELDLTGGRGCSAWSRSGALLWEDRGLLEKTASLLGRYPEGRSGKRGIEVEGVAAAAFGDRDYLFVLAERGSFMAVFDIDRPEAPALRQILPTGDSPEGVVAIPSRSLVVTADEESGTLTIFEGVPGTVPSLPR